MDNINRDKVIIDALRVDTIIGVNEWERSVKQTLVITVELSCDVQKAAASDHLGDAVDYVRIASRIVTFTSGCQFQLMETLAEQLAQLLLKEFLIDYVKINLRKSSALPQVASAGVQVERSRKTN